MKIKLGIFLILTVTAVATMIAFLHSRPHSMTADPQSPKSEFAATHSGPPSRISEASQPPQPIVRHVEERTVAAEPAEKPWPTTNKLVRLKQIRENFVALAAGDPATALRAAKQLTDETERETALLALVTEWTHGELGPARRRARAIDAYGLEAGLAIELEGKPDLALLWANELTEGPARNAVLLQTAVAAVKSEPAAAFALSGEIPEADRRGFLDSIFASWGGTDTDAALKWADQLPDEAERDAAIAAIRTTAPVGIGAALKMEDGYAVINQLLPGTPAEQSGQLRPGDRIVALAQGDNSYVDAYRLPLENVVQMVRGLPNTILQLQVLSADAPPNSQPRIVSIPRGQLKFKQ